MLKVLGTTVLKHILHFSDKLLPKYIDKKCIKGIANLLIGIPS